MNRRLCVNHPDNFCHVCGQQSTRSPQDQCKNISRRLKTAYKHYFGCQLRDQDKTWAPHVCCTVCYSGLNGKWKKMPFAVPMVWREPTNHHSDCYLFDEHCSIHKEEWVEDCVSWLPVCYQAHSSSWFGESCSNSSFHAWSRWRRSSDKECATADVDKLYDPEPDEEKPYLLTQEDLNDLIRDLSLTIKGESRVVRFTAETVESATEGD